MKIHVMIDQVKILIAAPILILLATSCSVEKMLADINTKWAADNEIIKKNTCQSEVPLNKNSTISALQFAFNELDLIIENSDLRTGLVTGVGKAPKPLSYQEFERVKSVEGPKIDNPLFAWRTDFNIIVSATVLERSSRNSTFVTLRGRMDFHGNRDTFRPLSELPPEGLKIACSKIWEKMNESGMIDRTLPENGGFKGKIIPRHQASF